ncbi:MAG TPA: hypothetical protein VFJ17_06180 [Mycobacteriales bacterium]|jgi:hypothetical protein|nr:hypothetical protein [Mycobacteriales bacterium]
MRTTVALAVALGFCALTAAPAAAEDTSPQTIYCVEPIVINVGGTQLPATPEICVPGP